MKCFPNSVILSCCPDEKPLDSVLISGAETKLFQRVEAHRESFSSLTVGQTSHSVEFTEVLSETSSTSWRTVDPHEESVNSVETSFHSNSGFRLLPSPKLLKEMHDITVKSGEMAKFSCLFNGHPFTVVAWDHNGQNLVDTERVRSSQSGGLLSLTIHSVSVADQGKYRCKATNQHGQSSSSAQLIVEGASSYLHPNQLHLTSSSALSCFLDILWFKCSFLSVTCKTVME